MTDKVYMKKTDNSLWEKNPTLAGGLYIFIGAIIFLVVCVGILVDVSVEVLFFSYIILMLVIVIHQNQRHNISTSIAFIKRGDKLYALNLLYARSRSASSRSAVYAPSETMLQAATLDNNVKAAMGVQASEHEVIERRKNAQSFSDGLDDVLSEIEKKPKLYHVDADKDQPKLFFYCWWLVENNGLCDISTKKANYKILILDNPKVEKVKKHWFLVSYDNEIGERCTSKFTNCYGDLEEIFG